MSGIDISVSGLDKIEASIKDFAAIAEKGLDRGAKALLDSRAAEVSKTYRRKIPTRGDVAKGNRVANLKAASTNKKGKPKKSFKQDDFDAFAENAANVGNGAKSGEPAWTRSGDLQRGQAIVSKPGERQIVTTGPAAEPIKNWDGGYAEKNQTLPPSKYDGVKRANNYPVNAAKATERQLPIVIEKEIENELKRRGLS